MARSFDYTGAKNALCSVRELIDAIQQLRATVTNTFETLIGGTSVSGTHRSWSCKRDLEDLAEALDTSMDILNWRTAVMLSATVDPLFCSLGAAGMLLERCPDNIDLIWNLLKTYTWYTTMRGLAEHGQDAIFPCKRLVSVIEESLAYARSHEYASLLEDLKTRNFPSPDVEKYLFSVLPNRFLELKMEVIYTQGSTRIMQVTISSVLYVVMAFKGIVVEKILARALDEDIDTETNLSNMFRPSRYECMRRITDHAVSALLFAECRYSNIRDKSIFIFSWLQSYSTLFSSCCHKCVRILHNGVPPTWRHFETYMPFHIVCKY